VAPPASKLLVGKGVTCEEVVGSLDDPLPERRRAHLERCRDCRGYAASYFDVVHLVRTLSWAEPTGPESADGALIDSLLEGARRRGV
jgi:hypothetical protein